MVRNLAFVLPTRPGPDCAHAHAATMLQATTEQQAVLVHALKQHQKDIIDNLQNKLEGGPSTRMRRPPARAYTRLGNRRLCCAVRAGAPRLPCGCRGGPDGTGLLGSMGHGSVWRRRTSSARARAVAAPRRDQTALERARQGLIRGAHSLRGRMWLVATVCVACRDCDAPTAINPRWASDQCGRWRC